MKTLKLFLLGIILLSMTSLLMAQAPEGFSYQGVVRDNGAVLGSTPVTIKINIRSTTPTGTVVYSETHSQTTNPYGVFSLTVGQGTVVSGIFANIAWDANSYYTETEIDFGSGYQSMGTTQLMSVPYALHAKTAENGTQWSENGSRIYYNMANVGIGVSSPQAALHVDSVIALTHGLEYFSIKTNVAGQMLFIPNSAIGNATPSLVLDDQSGNKIGMGTATPEDKLHVVGGGVQVDKTTTTPKKNTVYGNALPLAYGYISSSGSVYSSDFGITSVNKTATGVYEITLDNNYVGVPAVMATSYNNSITNGEVITYSSSAPNKVYVHISNTSGTGVDSAFSVVVFGTAQ